MNTTIYRVKIKLSYKELVFDFTDVQSALRFLEDATGSYNISKSSEGKMPEVVLSVIDEIDEATADKIMLETMMEDTF